MKNQELGQADIEQFMLIVRGLDPNHDILYNEFFTQLKEVAQEISDPHLQDALFKSIYSLDDNLSGTEGDDVIRSWAGNDTVKAGLGDDIVYGGADHDTLYGEQGRDVIYGDGGKDKIYGGDGNDTLIGGNGDDTLDGGAGNDIYRFSLGDGNDIINSYDSATNKVDQIVFADGIAPAEVSLKRTGNDLIIKYSAEDQVTVQSFFDSNGATAYRIDQITFADQTVWDVGYIKAKILEASTTAGNDTIEGYSSNDVLSGEAGNDQIYGNNGSDQLCGGTGQDKLYGGNGDDHLEGGADNDQLYGGSGNDVLVGGTGDDRLEGQDGNDVLQGGDGDDTLDGGAGNDTYVFATNFGHDIISNYDNSENRQDIIQFTDGQVQADFTFRRINNDLVIHALDGENSITVQNYFQVDALGAYHIDQIQFSDESVLDVEAVKALVLLGTDGADTLQAYASGSTISGEAGDDQIY
ncbi:MAG: calcium-binding protein, partial [Acinetobacter sp.]